MTNSSAGTTAGLPAAFLRPGVSVTGGGEKVESTAAVSDKPRVMNEGSEGGICLRVFSPSVLDVGEC